jgi:hypothetical protein
MASFRKRNSTSIRLDDDGMHFVEHREVADEISNNFQSVNNNPCLDGFPSLSSSSEFLSLVPISDLDILKLLSI